MRVYLKNGKSIRVKKCVGKKLVKAVFEASENDNSIYVRLYDNSLIIKVSEIAYIK